HQQFAETPLRQYDDLAKLRAVETEQFACGLGDLLRLRGDALPFCADQAVELRFGLGLDHAFTALLRAQLGRRAPDAIALRAEREFRLNLGRQVLRRVVTAHGAGFALTAGGVTVQREADRIEQGRLAGAGRAVYQEQRAFAEQREGDALAPGKRPESLHAEDQRLHGASRPARSSAS